MKTKKNKIEEEFPIYLEETVISGFGRGSKKLQCPTANLSINEKLRNKLTESVNGVYLGFCQLPEDKVRKCVISIGKSPFFNDVRKKIIEVHIIDYIGEDFYGDKLKVVIVSFLRYMKKYDSINELKFDIHNDIKVVRGKLDNFKEYSNDIQRTYQKMIIYFFDELISRLKKQKNEKNMNQYHFLKENQEKKLKVCFDNYVKLKQFELARAVLKQIPEKDRIQKLQSTLEKVNETIEVKNFCLSELPYYKKLEYDLRLFDFEILLKSLYMNEIILKREVRKLDDLFLKHLRMIKTDSKKTILFCRLFEKAEYGEDEVEARAEDEEDSLKLKKSEILEIIPILKKLCDKELYVAYYLCELLISISPTLKFDVYSFYLDFILDLVNRKNVEKIVKILNFLKIDDEKELFLPLEPTIEKCLLIVVEERPPSFTPVFRSKFLVKTYSFFYEKNRDNKVYLNFSLIKKEHFLYQFISKLENLIEFKKIDNLPQMFVKNPELNILKNLLLLLTFDKYKQKDLNYLSELFSLLITPPVCNDQVNDKKIVISQPKTKIDQFLFYLVKKLTFYLNFSNWMSLKVFSFGEDLKNLPYCYTENFTVNYIKKIIFKKIYSKKSLIYICLPFVNLFNKIELLKKILEAKNEFKIDTQILKIFFFIYNCLTKNTLLEINAVLEINKKKVQIVFLENLFSIIFIKNKKKEFKFNNNLPLVKKIVQYIKNLSNKFNTDKIKNKVVIKRITSLKKKILLLEYKLSLILKLSLKTKIINLLVTSPKVFLLIAIKQNKFLLSKEINKKFKLKLKYLIEKENNFLLKKDDFKTNNFVYFFDLSLNLDLKKNNCNLNDIFTKSEVTLLKELNVTFSGSKESNKKQEKKTIVKRMFKKLKGKDLLLEIFKKQQNCLKRNYNLIAKILTFSKDFNFLEQLSQNENEKIENLLLPPQSSSKNKVDVTYEFNFLKSFILHLQKNSQLLNDKNILKEGIKKTICKLFFEEKIYKKSKELSNLNQLNLLKIIWKSLIFQIKKKEQFTDNLTGDRRDSSKQTSTGDDLPKATKHDIYKLDLEVFKFIFIENSIIAILIYILLRQEDNKKILEYIIENTTKHKILTNWLEFLFIKNENEELSTKKVLNNKEYYVSLIKTKIKKKELIEALRLSNKIHSSKYNDLIITKIIKKNPKLISKFIFRISNKLLIIDLVFKYYKQIEEINKIIELFSMCLGCCEKGSQNHFKMAEKHNEFLLYKEILQILNYKSWKEIKSLILNKKTPKLISQLNKLKKFELSKKLLKFFLKNSHELYLKTETLFLLNFFQNDQSSRPSVRVVSKTYSKKKTQVKQKRITQSVRVKRSGQEKKELDYNKLLHILVKHKENDGKILCENLLENKQLNYKKKIFICNFIITALRKTLSKEEYRLFTRKLNGLKIFLIIKNLSILNPNLFVKYEEKFKHLVDYPNLILENLIMFKEIKIIKKILKKINIEVILVKSDEVFLKYGLKALVLQNQKKKIKNLLKKESLTSTVSGNEIINQINQQSLMNEEKTNPLIYLSGDQNEALDFREKFQYDNTPDLILAKSLFDFVKKPSKISRVLLKYISKITFNFNESSSLSSVFFEKNNLNLIQLFTKILQYSKFCLLKDVEGHEEFMEHEKISEKFEVLKVLIYSNSIKLSQISINHLRDKNKIRQIRDQLIKGDYIKLALKVSQLCGIEVSPVLIEWGNMLLKINKFQEARSKFMQVFKTFGEYSSVNKKKVLKEILIILENKFVIFYKINDFKNMKQCVIEESKYYLKKYGTEDDYLKFFLKLNDTKTIMNYLLRKEINQFYFVSSILPYLYNYGELQNFRILLQQKKMDTQKERKYLILICKFLTNKAAYHLLYDFQCYMKDEFRCGITCIKIFLSKRKISLLNKAKQHFLKAIDNSKGQHTLNVSKYLRTINLQIELEKHIKVKKLELLMREKTLFHTHKDKCEIVEILITTNHNLAFKIMSDYNLPTLKLYKNTLRKQVKTMQVKDIEDLLKVMHRNVSLNENEKDMITQSLIQFYVNEKKMKSAERFINKIRDEQKKVRACLICKKYKTAFKFAVETGSKEDVNFIYESLKNIDTKEANSVKDYCVKWLANH